MSERFNQGQQHDPATSADYNQEQASYHDGASASVPATAYSTMHPAGGSYRADTMVRPGYAFASSAQSSSAASLYHNQAMAHSSDRSAAGAQQISHAVPAPFSQQATYPVQNAMSMGHLAAALPNASQMSTSYGAAMQMMPGQQTGAAMYGRQQPAHAYYQQQGINFAGQGGQNQHQERGFSMQGHQYPTTQQYVMPGFMPYPMYPQQQGSYYPPVHQQQQQPTSLRDGLDKSGRYGPAQRSHTGDSNQSFTAYQHDKNQYPFHAAQLLQENAFSSSGGKATYGSLPEGQATIPRGPPRKPKQSGHALWVGNLPPDATVSDLKDHFARGLVNDIESLKLISKSNCAFVNYKTQAACAMAMQKFHESRFHGIRLVCRLRRLSAPTTSNITGLPTHRGNVDSLVDGEVDGDTELSTASYNARVPDRFFVLKSLTLQDLNVSVRTGYWATQPHNEEILNKAYSSADNVYLIFSANKSGEYFGYARMTSAITDDPIPESFSPQVTKAVSSKTTSGTPQSERPPMVSTHSSGLTLTTVESGPRSILTPATEYAPAGRIIDDLARGTIFWEADPEVERLLQAASNPEETAAAEAGAQDDTLALSQIPTSTTNESEEQIELLQASGGSFRIEWISTRRVPFYSTRGLRNPWNVNREVKIARDGTELEPSVGKKLLALFGHPGIGRMSTNIGRGVGVGVGMGVLPITNITPGMIMAPGVGMSPGAGMGPGMGMY